MRYGAGVPTISDRDFLVLAICFKISRPEKDGGDYFVVGCDSIEHDGVPPFSDTWSVVRGELNTSGYLLEKKENGNATSITKIIQTDPKGLLPSWIMNMVATEEPCSIAKLGEFLTNHPEEYQQIISRVEEKRKAKAQ